MLGVQKKKMSEKFVSGTFLHFSLFCLSIDFDNFSSELQDFAIFVIIGFILKCFKLIEIRIFIWMYKV